MADAPLPGAMYRTRLPRKTRHKNGRGLFCCLTLANSTDDDADPAPGVMVE